MTARLAPEWVPPVAGRQSGLFTARQAREAGATRAQVRRRRDTGRWRTVLGDALALPSVPGSPWVRAQAAMLTWPDAIVCFASAAQLHGLPVRAPEHVDVIVPNRRPGRAGLCSHEIRIDDTEVAQRGLIRFTALQRTLFDCLGRLPRVESEALVAWAVTRERLDQDALAEALAHRPGWWGNTQRRAALSAARDGALSAAERRLHQILRRAGARGWAGDQRVYDGAGLIGRADVLFEAERLVIEVDGFEYHGRQRFQEDRRRQNRLVAAGFTVLRFTWADLTERPDDVARQIVQMLDTLHRLGIS